MLALIAATLIAAPGAAALPAPTDPPALAADAPPLRITINGGGDYRPGDRVRVQIEAGEDGYLVVFRVDGDGRIRVLFPLDPDLDPFVRGGKRYELRGRGERETFLADDQGGSGLIYAALSRDPLDLARYATGDHWDYTTLRLSAWDADAEPELTQIVKQMAGGGRFTYDVLGYRVHGEPYISGGGAIVSPAMYGYGDPFFDPYWSCLACGWGVRRPGVSVSVGFGGGWWDPWDPWYWNRFGSGGWGYGGWYDPWLFPGQYRPITVINLPRPQIPNTAYGFRARPRVTAPALVPDLGRGVRGTPQVPTGTRARPRPDAQQPTRAARPNEPQRAERGGPPSAPPSSTRPGGSVGGGTPPSTGGSAGGSTGGRSRPRTGGDAMTQAPEVPRAQMDRRAEESRPVVAVPERREAVPQPIFREPVRARPVDQEPQRAEVNRSQPVYREPPRVEPQRSEPRRAEPVRAEPQRSEPRRAEPVRAEPQRSEPRRAEPVRAEPQRSAPTRSEPVIRSAPPAPRPSAPPPSSGSGSTSGRSRRP